jgi:hypothetical protein
MDDSAPTSMKSAAIRDN